jgi:sugar/nucleoside kinase (ribokinase family)
VTAPLGRLVHVIGGVVIDVVMQVPALPEPGGDVIATRSVITPGGGLNVMVAATRQDLPVAYGGGHGTGPFGDLVRAALADAGIEVLRPPVPDLDTGFDVALVDATGERTFVTSEGAEATPGYEPLAGLALRRDDALYVSGYGLLQPTSRTGLLRWLRGLPDGIVVLVDPGPLVDDIPGEVLAAFLARADWWSCSHREAAAITGIADGVAAAEALATMTGRRGVLVRTGPTGCLLARRDQGTLHVPAFEVTAVDTNGAGDAHVGAFAAALAHGLDPYRAIRRANASAALAVTRFGPATAPTTAEVDAYLRTADEDGGCRRSTGTTTTRRS